MSGPQLVINDMRSRLISKGKVISDQQLRELQQKYEIPDHGNQWGMHPRENRYVLFQPCRVGIDGRYKPNQVRRIALQYGWLVMRGEDHKEFIDHRKIYQLYSPIRAADAYEGVQTNKDGVNRYVPEIDFANNASRNRFANMREITLPGKGPLWAHPREIDQEYLDHLSSWVRELRKKTKDNSEYWEWVREGKRDDMFWCEKAIIVLMAFDGLIGVHGKEADREGSDNDKVIT